MILKFHFRGAMQAIKESLLLLTDRFYNELVRTQEIVVILFIFNLVALIIGFGILIKEIRS